ncbi:MAG: type II secretion system protein M [Aestuariibacter sp.]|jgi:general secretion pathway protein M|nr:general secretion pathway protein GspM [Alteromonadaceae bacterium]MCP5012121.1 type II secretion system protein M [Aestuariibacter sp.]|tara:strand:+ start:16 stop:492 length:477 start_codon:yes stop_codon:yes gene_type:complete
MEFLKQKYAALTEREQRLVMLSAIVVLIGLFYWGIWAPLNQGIDQQTKQLSNNQKLLSWVEEQSARAAILRRSQSGNRTFNGSLQQAVTSSSNQFSLVISRMQPQNDNLQVWIDEAVFNDLLAWLDHLESRGVQIDQLDVTEADASGMIKVRRLVLSK